jgi:sugar/nucleoside kinase (ribokinase family)
VSPDYLAIGHLAKDLIPGGARLGGTVAYASLTAHALGYAPGLVTAYGEDLDLGPLTGFARVRGASAASTTFENLYGPHGRTQFIRAQAAPLTPDLIPVAWRRAAIVHLAPLAQEIDPAMAGGFTDAYLGLTPQGWLRAWDAEGRVRRTDWPQAPQTLTHAHAVVLSLEDVRGDWAVLERWAQAARVLIVTEGPRGCTVLVQGQERRRVPVEPRTEVDPTGAGDVFAAAFFIHYYETRDPWASARFANEVAAVSVTRAGLEGVPTPDEAALCRMRAARES